MSLPDIKYKLVEIILIKVHFIFLNCLELFIIENTLWRIYIFNLVFLYFVINALNMKRLCTWAKDWRITDSTVLEKIAKKSTIKQNGSFKIYVIMWVLMKWLDFRVLMNIGDKSGSYRPLKGLYLCNFICTYITFTVLQKSLFVSIFNVTCVSWKLCDWRKWMLKL